MPEYSYWIIAGLLLVIAEFMVSGLVVIFFGVAALVVGSAKYLGLINDLTWELTLFAVISVLLLVFVRRYLREQIMGRETDAEGPEDNAGLIGQRATVDAPFSKGFGSVSYRGARWQAQSSHSLESGDTVRITAHDGLLLTVEPWHSPSTPSPESSERRSL